VIILFLHLNGNIISYTNCWRLCV